MFYMFRAYWLWGGVSWKKLMLVYTSDMMIHGKPPMPMANEERKPCFFKRNIMLKSDQFYTTSIVFFSCLFYVENDFIRTTTPIHVKIGVSSSSMPYDCPRRKHIYNKYNRLDSKFVCHALVNDVNFTRKLKENARNKLKRHIPVVDTCNQNIMLKKNDSFASFHIWSENIAKVYQ